LNPGPFAASSSSLIAILIAKTRRLLIQVNVPNHRAGVFHKVNDCHGRAMHVDLKDRHSIMAIYPFELFESDAAQNSTAAAIWSLNRASPRKALDRYA
jgi:hypothetical protein